MAQSTKAMTTEGLIKDGVVHDHSSPFALPRGVAGRLAGWYMGLPDRQHREIIELIPVSPGQRVIEIGFGPGQVLAALRQREPTVELCGADPSELMLARARRRNPTADLRLGAAATLPFDDTSMDIVVAINNIAMWPSLDDALREIERVLRTGGTLIVAWHGGVDPRGHQRKLVMDERRLAEVDAGFGERFEFGRRQLQHSELWEARRR